MCEVYENHPNVMFVAASVALNAGALPVGLLLDRVEPRVPINVAPFIEVAGWSLLDRLDSRTFHMFVPAYIMITFGGRITMMWSFPASFPIIRYQTAILAAISCLVDGSSAMFLVLCAAHEHCGWSRKMLSERVKLMGTTPFVLTESCRYRFVISFRVNETIVNGWRFCTNVKKAVLATCDESCWVRMLHDPRATCLSFPSRMDGSSIRTFLLWEVHGQIRFVDDDHIKHLEQLYTFEIKRA
uniref:Uncharacterized protein n=1 Tax=Hyaloperonospora arabidopsidis (strain Emoy2) TaxID=559515 RepID=M4B4C9_HYAAE